MSGAHDPVANAVRKLHADIDQDALFDVVDTSRGDDETRTKTKAGKDKSGLVECPRCHQQVRPRPRSTTPGLHYLTDNSACTARRTP